MQPGQKYILFYKYPNTFKKLQAHVQYVLNVRWEKVFVDVKDYDVTSPFLLLRACSWPFFYVVSRSLVQKTWIFLAFGHDLFDVSLARTFVPCKENSKSFSDLFFFWQCPFLSSTQAFPFLDRPLLWNNYSHPLSRWKSSSEIHKLSVVNN